MIKTEIGLLKAMSDGAIVRRKWGGFRLMIGNTPGPSILPKLIPNLEESGKIKRIDDKISRCGEEWGINK